MTNSSHRWGGCQKRVDKADAYLGKRSELPFIFLLILFVLMDLPVLSNQASRDIYRRPTVEGLGKIWGSQHVRFNAGAMLYSRVLGTAQQLPSRLRGGRNDEGHKTPPGPKRRAPLRGTLKYGGKLKMQSREGVVHELESQPSSEDFAPGGIIEEQLLPEPVLGNGDEKEEESAPDPDFPPTEQGRKRKLEDSKETSNLATSLKRLRKIGVKTGEDRQKLRSEVIELRQQAQRGVGAAQEELARRLLSGTRGADGVQSRRLREGASWAQKAMEAHVAGAGELVAYCHLVGAGDKSKDPRRAYVLWRQSAEGGSGRAAFWVGHCLDGGVGVARNRSKAVEWYEQAARAGIPAAMYNAGVSYYNGDGVPVNHSRAVQWLTLAAEYGRDEWVQVAEGVSELKSLGDPQAQLLLGWCYMRGEGVAQDEEAGLEWLHKAGEQGELKAQFWLGACYYHGVGVEAGRFDEAMKWWEQAAGRGCLDSMHNLAVLHAEGKGVKRNERKAAAMLLRNADKGCKESARLAALCYLEARGVKRDEEGGLLRYMNATGVSRAQAQFEIGKRFVLGEGWLRTPNVERGIQWLEAAAADDHVDAMVMLAPRLTDRPSRPGKRDTRAALALLRTAASKGHAGAQLALGDYYRDGTAVKANISAALHLWASAAQSGSRNAKVRLAEFMAEASEGTSRDSTDKSKQLEEALALAGPDGSLKREMITWLEMAAEEGKPLAQVELGRQLLQGSEEDQAKAAVWFQRASTEEYAPPRAMYHLAMCYLHGRGVEKKPEVGARWLKAAAKKGDPEAAFSLSCCFAAGDGVPQREDKAWHWLQRAAEAGSPSAMFNAYVRLSSGRGVAKDEAGAQRWLEVAAEAGHAKARNNLALQLLSEGRTDEERAKGRELLLQAARQGHEGAAEVVQRLRLDAA